LRLRLRWRFEAQQESVDGEELFENAHERKRQRERERERKRERERESAEERKRD
jgi:hypothetical protein